MDIATFLKKRRRELNLTQEYVAERLNITTTTVSNIELGRPSIKFKVLNGLLDLYGLSLEVTQNDKKSSS